MSSTSKSFEFRSIILQFIDGLCSWSDWSKCSASCGSGFQTRQKTVSKDREAGIRNLESNECQGREEIGKRNCFLKPCQGIVGCTLIYLVLKVFFIIVYCGNGFQHPHFLITGLILVTKVFSSKCLLSTFFYRLFSSDPQK